MKDAVRDLDEPATRGISPVDVTVLGLVGGAPGGETPRVADSSCCGPGLLLVFSGGELDSNTLTQSR